MTNIFDVTSYGATGNGITDDSAAIQAAIAAATTAGNGVVFFPAGNYYYNNATPINLTNTTSILSEGQATITGGNTTTDCFVFNGGANSSDPKCNYLAGYFNLPYIANFQNGTAVRLVGVTFANIFIPNIQHCKHGLGFETSAAYTSCIDNTVNFGYIGGLTGAGVHILSSATGQSNQGHVVRGNFLMKFLYGVFFDSPSGQTPTWGSYLIEIEAMDASNYAGSMGVYAQNYGPQDSFNLKARTYFGSFASWYINMCSCNNSSFEISPDGNIGASKIYLGGGSNSIKSIIGYSQPITNPPVLAITTTNNLSGFNGGLPLGGSNRNYIGLPVPAMTAGSYADFYIYHSFVLGYSNSVRAIPHFTQPLVITCIEDESVVAGSDGHNAPYQIHIRVYALAAITASTQKLTIEVGN